MKIEMVCFEKPNRNPNIIIVEEPWFSQHFSLPVYIVYLLYIVTALVVTLYTVSICDVIGTTKIIGCDFLPSLFKT